MTIETLLLHLEEFFTIINSRKAFLLLLLLMILVSTMFGGNFAHVWLLCDTYTCALFLFYAIVCTLTGVRILNHYRRNMNIFRRVVSTDHNHGRTNIAFESDPTSGESKPNDMCATEKQRKRHNVDASENVLHDDENLSKNVFSKRESQFPVYRDDRKSKKKRKREEDEDMNKQKVICENRSMGSMPYQTHSSKFPDKSIIKVSKHPTSVFWRF